MIIAAITEAVMKCAVFDLRRTECDGCAHDFNPGLLGASAAAAVPVAPLPCRRDGRT